MPASETLSQLETRVLCLVSDEVLQTPPGFTVTSDLFDAGLDSMAIMQLLLLLEEHYGVAIPVGSVSRANFKTAQAIGALLVAQGYEVLPEELQVATEIAEVPAASVAETAEVMAPSAPEPMPLITSVPGLYASNLAPVPKS